jgi:uncharacterized protein (DUF58 family)
MDTGFDRSFTLSAKKHDLTVIRVSDPTEDEIPDLGLMTFQDPETGHVAMINTGNKALRQKWRTYRRDQTAALHNLVRKTGIDLVELRTDGPVMEPLTRLFDQRRKRF